MSSISTCQDIPVPLWHPPWRVVASRKSPYDLFTASSSSSQNCIYWFPKLCFSQSKTCRTWLCNLRTHMTSIMTDCHVSIPSWYSPCLSMMSPKSPYDLFTISSGQNCISRLPNFRFLPIQNMTDLAMLTVDTYAKYQYLSRCSSPTVTPPATWHCITKIHVQPPYDLLRSKLYTLASRDPFWSIQSMSGLVIQSQDTYTKYPNILWHFSPAATPNVTWYYLFILCYFGVYRTYLSLFPTLLLSGSLP